MLKVTGKVLSCEIREVKYKKNGKNNVFIENRAWIHNGFGDPRVVKFGDKFDIEVGQDIDVPVRVSTWGDKRGGIHYDLIAIYREE